MKIKIALLAVFYLIIAGCDSAVIAASKKPGILKPERPQKTYTSPTFSQTLNVQFELGTIINNSPTQELDIVYQPYSEGTADATTNWIATIGPQTTVELKKLLPLGISGYIQQDPADLQQLVQEKTPQELVNEWKYPFENFGGRLWVIDTLSKAVIMNIEIEHYRRKNDQERVEIGTDIYVYAFPGTPFEQEVDNLDLEGFEIDPKDREHYTLNLNLRPELNAIINSKASLDFELTSHQNPNNTMKFQAQ